MSIAAIISSIAIALSVASVLAGRHYSGLATAARNQAEASRASAEAAARRAGGHP